MHYTFIRPTKGLHANKLKLQCSANSLKPPLRELVSERVRNVGKSERLPICFMLMKTRKPSITKDYPCHNPFLMFRCNGKTHLQHSLNSIGNTLITLRFEVLSSFQSLCHDCQNFFVVKSLSELALPLLKLKNKTIQNKKYFPPIMPFLFFFPSITHFKSHLLARGIHFHPGVLPSLAF